MKQTILYIGVGLFLLVGIASRAWFFTDFRIRVGNKIFYILTFIELIVFAALLILIELDFSVYTKLLIIALAWSGSWFGSSYLYRKKGKVQQGNQGDWR